MEIESRQRLDGALGCTECTPRVRFTDSDLFIIENIAKKNGCRMEKLKSDANLFAPTVSLKAYRWYAEW